jgi:hypothetical protein
MRLRKSFNVTRYDGSGTQVHYDIEENHEFFKTVTADISKLELMEHVVTVDSQGNKYLITRWYNRPCQRNES